jgi:hypothetical protein
VYQTNSLPLGLRMLCTRRSERGGSS